MKAVLVLSLFIYLCSGVLIRQNGERELDWWETTILYQIYPRSFADSDGDGIGDLNGITSRMEYFQEIGVGAIWLSPIFQSPMYDFGYDISDFYAIHYEYGTMEDFEALLHRANELNIKVLLDFVPNHTSNESVWFQEALKGNEKYYNYFIWEDGVIDDNGNRQPPNNWISFFRGSAWEYKEEVGKYYLHQFLVGQPELNFRNREVIEEMNNVIRFWLEKGVAGFRVDAVKCLYEVDKELFGGRYPDEPLSGISGVLPDQHEYLHHIYTNDQNESYYLVYEWRDVIDEFTETHGGFTRVMMTEVYTEIQNVVKYFGQGDRLGAHVPFNFDLVKDVNKTSTAADMKLAVDKFLTYKPVDKGANWVVGNHDNSRTATRYGDALVDGINMLVLLLPGVGVTYMGEEIGLEDGYVSWEDSVDPFACNSHDPVNYVAFSRDPERTPFQWNSERNAGFSTADRPWLPVADNYETLNVEVQRTADKSHLKVYQALANLRQDRVFRYGRYDSLALNEGVFAFRRLYDNETYLVVINMRNTDYVLDFTYFENVYGNYSVVLSSIQSPKNVGDTFDVSSLPVAGHEGVVLKGN